jgi:ORF6N domain-containing protein
MTVLAVSVLWDAATVPRTNPDQEPGAIADWIDPVVTPAKRSAFGALYGLPALPQAIVGLTRPNGCRIFMSTKSIIPAEHIEQSIYLIRGEKVMLDVDLAGLYGVETRALVQAVKRNPARFPDDFMFQLTQQEFAALQSQIVISKGRGGRRTAPYASGNFWRPTPILPGRWPCSSRSTTPNLGSYSRPSGN